MAGSQPPRCYVNKHALVDLALFGPVERLGALLEETTATACRLGVNPRRTKPLKKVPRGVGTYPMMLDVKRWLEGIRPEDKEDIMFLKQVHQTVSVRLNP